MPPQFNIRITPAAPDAQQHIPYIDVTVETTGLSVKKGEPVYEVTANTGFGVTSAKDFRDLTFSDALGPLATATGDVPDDGSGVTRLWRAARDVKGPVRAHYRVPINASAPPVALPQYELRTEFGTFSAASNSFLLVPADAIKRTAKVEWDFTSYGNGGIGISSLGTGSTTSNVPRSGEEMSAIYFMGGHPGTVARTADGFFAAWQGKPPFPMTPLLTWAGILHRFYGSVFGFAPASFGIFARTNTINPGSGVGLTDSFAFTYNESTKANELRSILAHEMVHTFIHGLDPAKNATTDQGSSWFSEGLAVHYQRRLPYKAGMISIAEYLKDINQTASRYYTNIRINVSNSQIPLGFWTDGNIRVLAYDRGSLYFDKVDAQIRATSRGKRSLDDIVRTMLTARHSERPMDEALYRSLIDAELGPQGIKDLDAMLAGETVVPPSDAYGPEFRRVVVPLRRYEIGYEKMRSGDHSNIVRSVVAMSNAAKAGLKVGDEILSSRDGDALQLDQDADNELIIKRAGRMLNLHYLPRGEKIEGYQWIAARR
ncbi:M61 glycyl aminopeptidase [Sphingomonas sp. PP-F2F-A104-K0414]|nr:M61 glycyl aminopeptidase [Sphingomonas sp. PP-F2F-A104-K0414]